MYDIGVIGPVTRDLIHIGAQPQKAMPGGVVCYAGHTYRQLGVKTAILTKAVVAEAEILLAELSDGVSLYCRDSATTTAFENLYRQDNPDVRTQRVTAVAASYSPGDLQNLQARAFHLGPLSESDMDSGFIAAVAQRGPVYLDVQGLLRRVVNGKVVPVNWADKRAGLAHVHGLKADLAEARLLSGETNPERAARGIAGYGPREVLVTLGSKGTLVLHQRRLQHIPAYPAERIVDATGCGDTFFAGYISQRLRGADVVTATGFAAAVAVLKLEQNGPFVSNQNAVLHLIDQHTARAPDKTWNAHSDWYREEGGDHTTWRN